MQKMSQNKYIDEFMNTFPFEGLTFDDVSLITQYAEFLPGDSDISTRLTRNITMKIPFLSAAMDTVTEARMAISMAMMGGIGVIHKNLDPEVQAQHVSRVKHHLNGLISTPVTFNINDTLETIAHKRSDKGYSFSGFPILDDEGKLVGILTSKDIRFSRSKRAKVTDVMTTDVITASKTRHQSAAGIRHHAAAQDRKAASAGKGQTGGSLQLCRRAPPDRKRRTAVQPR